MITDEEAARAWVAALPGVDASAIARLEKLAALLAEENQLQNLVSASSLGEVWRRHIADSAQLLALIPQGAVIESWLDLGTGAGFPGLAVACLRPDVEVVMVESRARRIAWLQRAAEALGLTRASILGQRLEHVATRTFDAISARAFAPLDKLLALSARFSTSDTIWLLPKGRSAPQELQMLSGWRHVFHVEQSLTDPEAGIIVGTLAGSVSGAKRKGTVR
ncbi:MAG: 16S rRNA (guanine(527)-N(7))-methyltransferase RsmG [Novosphingobium sp.]